MLSPISPLNRFHAHVASEGTITVDLKFKKALTEAITLIVVGCFNTDVLIDKDGKVGIA